MNMIKNTALALSLAFSFSFISVSAHAAEAAKSSASGVNEVIMHLVEAKSEINHRDFVPPSEHLSAAREASKKVTGNADVAKQAHAAIIQAQIKVKKYDKTGATEEVDKALKLYESIRTE